MVGKEVGRRRYVHVEQLPELESGICNLVEQAREVLQRHTAASCNVLRINEDLAEFAFLDYPALAQVPFPRLANSWRVHPASSLISHRTYTESLNPPILHRTELLLGDTQIASPGVV